MTDEPDPMSVMVAGLIHKLGRLLLSPNKAGRDDIITLQARYVAVLAEVAKFLKAAGAQLKAAGHEDISLKILVLADAIEQLRNGTVADVLQHTPVGGRGPDGIVLWGLRHEVVIGLECLLRSRKFKTHEKTAKYIADEYPVFDRLKRDPSDSLTTSILSWRRRINDGDVPEAEDVLAHQRRFFEQYGGDDRSPNEMFAVGEQLLAQAAERVTKAVL
jgi:hypothetical protein